MFNSSAVFIAFLAFFARLVCSDVLARIDGGTHIIGVYWPGKLHKYFQFVRHIIFKEWKLRSICFGTLDFQGESTRTLHQGKPFTYKRSTV